MGATVRGVKFLPQLTSGEKASVSRGRLRLSLGHQGEKGELNLGTPGMKGSSTLPPEGSLERRSPTFSLVGQGGTSGVSLVIRREGVQP